MPLEERIVAYIRINGMHLLLDDEALLRNEAVAEDASDMEGCEDCGAHLPEGGRVERRGFTALLVCGCGHEYPVVGAVPRLIIDRLLPVDVYIIQGRVQARQAELRKRRGLKVLYSRSRWTQVASRISSYLRKRNLPAEPTPEMRAAMLLRLGWTVQALRLREECQDLVQPERLVSTQDGGIVWCIPLQLA